MFRVIVLLGLVVGSWLGSCCGWAVLVSVCVSPGMNFFVSPDFLNFRMILLGSCSVVVSDWVGRVLYLFWLVVFVYLWICCNKVV